MAAKYQLITELYRRTGIAVAKNPQAWQNFLAAASGSVRVTIYTCDKETLLGLILISSVLHYIDHRLQVDFGVFRVGGLFGIFGIVNWMVEPATHIPYLADRHYDDLRGSRYLLRMSI